LGEFEDLREQLEAWSLFLTLNKLLTKEGLGIMAFGNLILFLQGIYILIRVEAE
jgi:hypothetical protein